MVIIVDNTVSCILKVATRGNLKILITREKKLNMRGWMLTKFAVVIILQYEHKSSCCTSKLIQCYI